MICYLLYSGSFLLFPLWRTLSSERHFIVSGTAPTWTLFSVGLHHNPSLTVVRSFSHFLTEWSGTCRTQDHFCCFHCAKRCRRRGTSAWVEQLRPQPNTPPIHKKCFGDGILAHDTRLQRIWTLLQPLHRHSEITPEVHKYYWGGVNKSSTSSALSKIHVGHWKAWRLSPHHKPLHGMD